VHIMENSHKQKMNSILQEMIIVLLFIFRFVTISDLYEPVEGSEKSNVCYHFPLYLLKGTLCSYFYCQVELNFTIFFKRLTVIMVIDQQLILKNVLDKI
jgi:hypothetical protein